MTKCCIVHKLWSLNTLVKNQYPVPLLPDLCHLMFDLTSRWQLTTPIKLSTPQGLTAWTFTLYTLLRVGSGIRQTKESRTKMPMEETFSKSRSSLQFWSKQISFFYKHSEDTRLELCQLTIAKNLFLFELQIFEGKKCKKSSSNLKLSGHKYDLAHKPLLRRASLRDAGSPRDPSNWEA